MRPKSWVMSRGVLPACSTPGCAPARGPPRVPLLQASDTVQRRTRQYSIAREKLASSENRRGVRSADFCSLVFNFMNPRHLAPAQGIEIIHFDDDSAGMAKQLPSIRNTTARYNETTVLTSISTDPPDWDGFVNAVTGSNARIVVPTMHGWNDGNIGPSCTNGWRRVEEAFPAGGITAPTLVLFSCDQWANRDAWRQAAPSSRLVLRDGNAFRIASLLRNLLGPRNGELTPSLLAWHVI